MITATEKFNAMQLKTNLPDIRPGAVVRVHQKIKESFGKAQDKGAKERIQVFEGLVIAKKHGKGINTTVTVRKVVDGVGVERIFPIHSPSIEKIEIVRLGKVRRAKLYYLRTAKGKKAKLKQREFGIETPESEPEPELKSETEKEGEPGPENEPKQQKSA